MKNTERIVWIVVLAVVSGWALTRDGKEISAQFPDKRNSTERRSQSRDSAGMTEDRQDRRAGAKRSTSVPVAARTQQALRNPDPLERMTDLLKVLSSCDSTNLDQVLAAWEEMKATGIQLPAEESFLEIRTGQIKGAELLSGCTGSAADWSRMDSRRNQFKGWVQADPFAAARWLEQLPAGKFRDQMALIHIAAAAKDDPQGAMTRLSSLPPQLQARAGQEMATSLRQTESIGTGSDVLKAMEARAGEKDAVSLNAMFTTLLDTAVNAGDGQAITLLESHLGQPYIGDSTWVQVSEAQGKSRDAASALEWALTAEIRNSHLPEGTLLTSAVREMPMNKLLEAEAWSAKNADKPGVAAMQGELSRRISVLEDRGDDANEYDKDD